MSPSRVRWGILLILIGGTFLAINLGYLSWWVWVDLLFLWPVILIAIGLEMIVKKTKMEMLGYLSSLLIIGSFVWAIDENGGFTSSTYGSDSLDRSQAALNYSGEQSASVKLNFGNGRLYVNSDDSKLVRVNSQGPSNRIAMRSNCESGRCEVELGIRSKSIFKRSNFIGNDNYWKCYAHPDVDLTYTFDLDDTDLRMFAQDLKISTLDVSADHSDLLVKLGTAAPQVTVKLSGRSSDYDLILPDSVGVRLEGVSLSQSVRESLGITDYGSYQANALAGTAAVNFTIVGNLDNSKVSLSYYNTEPTPDGSI